MVEDNKLISIKNLTVEYTSGDQVIHAVNGVSFDIEKGKTLGLVGETGAGKTSIAKAILKILPDPPARICSGEIIFNGEDILSMKENQLRAIRGAGISMIFQDPMTALNPTMRVGEQIADVIRLHRGIGKSESEKAAKEMLELVGIPGSRAREYPHQFSGGMKQRVVIAIALACNPQLLLADEPTTALDVTIQAQVLELIGQLKEKNNTSMLLITHDLGIVAENCDHVAVIYAGEIVEYGNLEEIFTNASHPYTIGLFNSLPDMNKHRDRLEPINGQPPNPADLPSGCKFNPRCPYATEACRAGTIDYVGLGGTHLCKCRNTDKVKKRNPSGSE